MSDFLLVAPYARRMPDPTYADVSRHIMFVQLKTLPDGMPFGANPREQNFDRMVYKTVKESMLAEGDGNFHLKHKGITIVAQAVSRIEGTDQYVVRFDDKSELQGVLDGGHSYGLIARHREELPDDQYVKVEVLTGLDPELIPDIAGGLNTSVQVQAMSLDNLRGAFDWIQEALKGEPYYDNIVWKENAKGDYDAREIIALLQLFNVFAYPNSDQGRFPVQAYSSKAAVLKYYEENIDEFKKLKPILKDILVLADTMSCEAKTLYNKAYPGAKGGKAHFNDHHPNGTAKPFKFTFIGKTGPDKLMNGALYPMLSAFRWMVIVDEKTGLAQWKRPFPEILKMWREMAGDLFMSTLEMGRDLGYNPMALGKNKSHWANVYRAVAMKDLMSQQ